MTSDSACCSTEAGRGFAQWFDRHAIEAQEWTAFVDVVPLSRVDEISGMARTRAGAWAEFAEALEQRASSGRLHPRPGRRGGVEDPGDTAHRITGAWAPTP